MDWEFFWSSEHGRDRLLRDRLEDYQGRAAAARSQQRRQFERQLGELRGDLDTRLTALTRAFDAYVELDDVREQLAGFPEQARARRRATEALQALAEGRQPEPLDDLAGYWLPAAVNALRPDGRPDPAGVGVALDRDATSTRRFLTGVLGAAGHGRAGARHAVDSLATDRWDDAQQLIWLAVADRVFGAEAITHLHGVVRPALDAVGDEGWTQWLADRGAGIDAQLDWVIAFYQPEADPEPDDGARHRDDLQGVAMIEITEGSPPEQPLIARARQLRMMVRDPMTEPADAEPNPGVEVAHVLQRAALAENGPAGARQLARRWLAPYLLGVLDRMPTPTPDEPVVLRAKSAAVNVAVTAAGPDPKDLAEAERWVRERHTPSNTPLIRGGAIAGGLLVLAVVCLVLTWTWLAVLLAIAALVVGVRGFWEWQQQQQLVLDGQDAMARLHESVQQTRVQAERQDELHAELIRKRIDLITEAKQRVAESA
ncbi:MAG: hypothetical protein GXX86_09095 [Propionibacterium sp.]|nr:hypothetical protein [Propionibacterium sp.]